MIIECAKHPVKALGMVGVLKAGGGCGIARCAANRCADDGNMAGIYQRRMYGSGVTLASKKKAGRIGISQGAFYPYVITHTGPQEAWRTVFANGKGQYDLLTTDQRLLLSKQARSLCMSGYNLFMSRWLQSHRS